MLKNYATSNQNKENSINLKRSYLALILLLVSITIIAQNNIKKSPFLHSLDQQIEKNYVPRQMNMGIDEITINIPMLYVQLLGSAMRNQKSYLKQNPNSLEKFENLHKEIISIIPQIANVYNSTNSSKTGYEYNDATTLEDYYYRALEGIFSQNFKQHYKEQSGKDIAQVNIPFVLEPMEPNYIKEAKKDDAIILLGIEADEVKGLPDPKYIHRSFPEDFIVGTWTNYMGETITFKKKGNVYIGVIKRKFNYDYGREYDGSPIEKIGIQTKTYEIHHSRLEATSQDPKNPNWYAFFWRYYKGKCYTSYVPQGVVWEEDTIQESTSSISWMDKDKNFYLSLDTYNFHRK